MTEGILNVSDDNFEEEVLKNELPVLVDFWAVWCAPCQMIVPILEYLVENYKDKLKICKLNVDENMKTSSNYGVRSIPTILLFKDGELKETMIGALPQDKIIDMISKHL
ncbi:MAG: thioredoxin [Candidatus Aminicenantes bacterium]|nr:thioredoxin [Candidatus Aminicenantes bacterium]MBL7084328.1 thioredoxin [Candidatus Aminicenantes bacterium]